MTPVGQISPQSAAASNLNTSGINGGVTLVPGSAAGPGTGVGSPNEVAVKVAVRVN